MKRNESLYNLAQQNEVFVFLKYLPKAVMAIIDKDSYKGEGRPAHELFDILICLMIQHYIGFSTRRSIGIIELMTRFARIHVKIPCFKTLCNYRNDPVIRKYLDNLIAVTSKPLSVLETDFSTDSTGCSTTCFSTWYSIKAGKKSRRRDHIMSHVTSSRVLNSAISVNVDCEHGKDSIYLRKHIERVRMYFNINDWCGDSAYLSRENCNAVAEAGGKPWFKLKKHIRAKQRGSRAWGLMVEEFRNNPEESEKHYHKRSNSESTIGAKKRKFGSFVRSRNDDAKENEEHLKWISYNFSVLSRAYYEYDIRPTF